MGVVFETRTLASGVGVSLGLDSLGDGTPLTTMFGWFFSDACFCIMTAKVLKLGYAS